MEDHKIVELYWERSERALKETHGKYGRMLGSISYSLLSSYEDAEECLDDTYLAAWNSMPTDRPEYLGAYLAKIIRRISVSKYRREHAQKRGGTEAICMELLECVSDGSTPERELENGRLTETLNKFLLSETERNRAVFVRRYFFSQSIEQISHETGIKAGSVKSILHRMRASLGKILREEELL